jgi:hypothetical protein
VAGRLAGPRIVLPALALAQRVGIRGGRLTEAVVGRRAGAGDDVDPADRHRGLVAEGVVDVIGLQSQRRGGRLDHLQGQQAGRAVMGEGQCPRAARRPGRAGPGPISPHNATAAVTRQMIRPMSPSHHARNARYNSRTNVRHRVPAARRRSAFKCTVTVIGDKFSALSP